MIQSLKAITKVGSDDEKKLTTIEKVKLTAGFLIGIGADMTVAALIGRYLPNVSGWRKVMMRLGAFVIAMKIGEECEKYFCTVYEETATAIKEAHDEIKAAEEAEGVVE